MALTTTTHSDPPLNDDSLCSLPQQNQEDCSSSSLQETPFSMGSPGKYLSGVSRVEMAWAHWTKLGRPKFIVAPMVDNSELPFRMLCRKYGAEAAYTPMLHSRIFSENPKYRSEEFTTCNEDRPLFVQFCANDPDTLLEAARRVESYCDYVDINLGVFPKLEDTLKYAKMLEDAGCSLLAVHGRTRDEKDGKKFRADWNAIKAVKNELRIPVLANGNVRHMDDVQNCLEETGADGVLSAETLLENPALFAGFRTADWVSDNENGYVDGKLDQADLVVEYLKLCEKYPVPWRMIRSHVHKLLGDWFRLQPQVREDLNAQSRLTFEFLYGLVDRLRELGVRVPLHQKDTSAARDSAEVSRIEL
ncbi:hypothetical protein V6N13_111488 [Hibiscus sabdariffa]|uniref:DUS-like FMN-binding domain-containing protein n=1 Tax=Hibiscus sabdariffa TaxID=183260 RepID=A0ABR2TL86_9ROSI